MKLTSNAAVTRILYEGVTDFRSLLDFDRESIEALGKACARDIPATVADAANNITAENKVPGANLSSISIRRLVVAMHAAKYYDAIGRTSTINNMHYNNVLVAFKSDYEAYTLLKKQDAPEVPLSLTLLNKLSIYWRVSQVRIALFRLPWVTFVLIQTT